MAEHIAVTRFREYLQIKSIQPEPDYVGCVEFLTKYAIEVGLDIQVVEPHPDRPFVILSWKGTDPSLKSIILHSHMDVVPVFPEFWDRDPFGAEKDAEGNIFARGAQDMKCVGIQYVEAIRKLKETGVNLKRTIHVTFSSDEEISGKLGMAKFVEHNAFKELNHAFSLDEGLAFPDDTYRIYYAERSPWWLKVICKGDPGHGSKFIENTAAEKFRKIVNSFLSFRDSQMQKLKADPNLTLGDVISLNLTKVEGGVQVNVVPAELAAYFDIRVPPTVDKNAFLKQIDAWVNESGPGVEIEWLVFTWIPYITDTSKDDKWWLAFSGALDGLGLKYKKEIFSAGTDARYLRNLGYPALGFSPMVGTPQLLHDHNEFLNEDVFLKGVDIYVKVISALGNVPE